MDEVWKPVPNYEGYYEASTWGRVRRIKSERATFPGRILKQELTYEGYHRVILSRLGRIKRYQTHRLILTTFVGPAPVGYECNHKDGVHSNNHVDNLEWVTKSENAQHKHYELGLCIGRKHQNVKEMIVTSPEGQVFHVFGLTPFCKAHGLDHGLMIKVAKGRQRKHHKGWGCSYAKN